MRRLIVTTAALAGLVLAASAAATLPTQRTVYRGYTSEHQINGYRPTIQFVASAGGRTLRNFVFQTLGCFGAGSFPVGTDPFFEYPWHLPSIPVATTGTYSAKLKATPASTDAGTMTATVTGSFTNATTVSGKITFSQAQNGATCGPRTVNFTVSSNAPPA
jgi:hypothetical protein